jgi:hypothetical protein
MSGPARFLYGLVLGLSLGIIGARLAGAAGSENGASQANGRRQTARRRAKTASKG